MKRAFLSLVAGVLLLASLSARAEGVLVAPQLTLASEGPVTATLVATTPSFSGSFTIGFESSAMGGGAQGFFLNTPGQQFTITLQDIIQNVLQPVPAGTNVFLMANFSQNGSTISSSTQVSDFTEQNFEVTLPGDPPRLVLENAGVVQTGPSSVLIGFSPTGVAAGGGIGGFGVRLSVSNVCVRG